MNLNYSKLLLLISNFSDENNKNIVKIIQTIYQKVFLNY